MDSQSVKNTDSADRGYDAGKKVSIKTSRWTRKDCPMGCTADVTDGALAMFDENRSDLSQVQQGEHTVLLGAPRLTNCTPSWCAEAMGGGAVFRLAGSY